MDFSPPNGFTVNNAFTNNVYRDVYPAISPDRPEVSQKDKVILITGASRGIGRDGVAQAFATAGAKAIIITSRKVEQLKDTEAAIKKSNPAVEVLAVPLELTNEISINQAFATITSKYPTIDVLVNNAGVFESMGQKIADADISKWWFDLEVNVKGTFLVTRAYLSHLKPDQKAKVVFMSSGAAFFNVPGVSSYAIAKLADLRLAAFVAAEHPNNVQVTAMHPGIVATDMATGDFIPYAKDTPLLAGALAVWLASDESSFLNGRYTTVNWDVSELIARKEEIVQKDLLTVQLSGLNGKVAELKN